MSDNPKMPRVINISNTPMDSRNAGATYWCGLSGGAIFANQTEYTLKSQADALAEALREAYEFARIMKNRSHGSNQSNYELSDENMGKMSAALAAYQEGG